MAGLLGGIKDPLQEQLDKPCPLCGKALQPETVHPIALVAWFLNAIGGYYVCEECYRLLIVATGSNKAAGALCALLYGLKKP
jgi:C4-type Zn-finger protein